MTREEAIHWMTILKKSTVNWVGEVDSNIKARCEEAEQEAFDMAIEALSAEAVHGWIPVSEKPKEEKKEYLVQLDSGGMCSCRWTNANPIWTGLTTDWHWNIFDIPQYCKVVAWMDLKPYREDGEA